jgi:hypothetical protein
MANLLGDTRFGKQIVDGDSDKGVSGASWNLASGRVSCSLRVLGQSRNEHLVPESEVSKG